MQRKAASAWMQLLAHPATHDAMRSLAQGNDPRGVLAGLAGDLIAHEVAKAVGAKSLPTRHGEKRARRQEQKSARPKVEKMREEDIVDAEFTVINVTPRGAKKAG